MMNKNKTSNINPAVKETISTNIPILQTTKWFQGPPKSVNKFLAEISSREKYLFLSPETGESTKGLYARCYAKAVFYIRS